MIFISMGILGLSAIRRQKIKKSENPEWSDVMGTYFNENKLEMKQSEADALNKTKWKTNEVWIYKLLSSILIPWGVYEQKKLIWLRKAWKCYWPLCHKYGVDL